MNCCNIQGPPAGLWDKVEEAMYRLMPGWFDKMDELMSSDEPFSSIHIITDIASKNPNKPLDDIIHEYFAEDWFKYHEDGDEEW